MKAGEISIDLSINDKDFTVRLQNGEKILSRFTKQMESTARSTKVVENHFSSLSTRFRHFMIMVASARFALMDINQVFLTLPASILKTSGEFERMTKLLEGLSTEADRAKDALSAKNFIIGFAKNAPFEINALTDAFVKMKSGGIDPMKGGFDALVNAVAQFGGNSEVLKRASIAIQQMAGKGVISMEELRQQLGEAVPTAMRMMADGMGVSMAELAKQVSKGIVTAGPALNKMFEVMRVESAQSAEEMMNTWVGATARLKTEWDLLKNQIGEGGFSAEATRVVRELSNALASDEFKRASKEISTLLTGSIKTVESFIKTLVEYREIIGDVAKIIVTIWGSGKVMGLLGSIGGRWRELKSEANSASVAVIAAHQREIRSIRQVAEANRIANLEQAASAERKYRVLTAEAAKYEASYKRHMQAVALHESAARMAIATGARSSLTGGFGGMAAAQAQAAKEMANASAARQAAEQIARMGNANLDAAQKAKVLAENARKAASETNQQARQAISAVAANARWQASVGKLGVVFNALGGWVTAVGLVITAGIAIWQRWGEAAERAANRANSAAAAVRAAQDGQATEEGLKATQEDARVARTRIETLERRVGGSLTAQEKKELEQLREKLRIQEESIEVQKRIVERGKEEENLAWLNREQENRLADMEVDTKRVMKEIDRKYGASPVGAKEQKARLAERDAAMRAMFEAQIKSINDQAELYSQEIKTGTNAAGKLTEAQIDARRRWVATTQDKVDAINERMKQFFDRSNMYQGGDKGDKGKGPTGLEKLLDRVADKLATINGELDKKGSGDLAKLINDISQLNPKDMIANGKKMTKEEVMDAILPGLIEGEWNLEFEKSFDKIAETIGSESLRISTEMDGGETSIAKLRDRLYELATAAEVAGDEARLKRVVDLVGQLNELQAQKSALSLKSLSSEFEESLASMRVSMSGDPRASAFAAWSNDVAKFQKMIVDAKLDVKDAEEAQRMFTEYVSVRYNQLQNDLKSPTQKLADDWTNAMKQMEDASKTVAERSMSALTEFFETGKLDARAFAADILKIFLEMHLKRAFGAQIAGASESLTGLFGSLTAFSTQGRQATQNVDGQNLATSVVKSATSEIKFGFGTMIEEVTTDFSRMFTQLSGGLGGMLQSLGSLIGGLFSMTGDGGKKGIGDWLVQGLTGAVMGYGTSAIGNAFSNVSTAYKYDTKIGSDQTKMLQAQEFAKGGIMTEFGALPLRKYANGGVAYSPQAAIFGEGRKPEAFVPLPDGRTIPVTVDGATGGANVVIDIDVVVNNDGTEKSVSNGDSSSWDKMAKRVKAVVVEEIINQRRPGGALQALA